MSELIMDSGALKFYDDNGNLVRIQGKNKNGEFGIWSDEDGLCPHERTRQYCEDCNE